MAFSLRRSIPLIITLGVLVLLGLFVGRVAFLYTKIQSGELTDSPDFAFTESVTFSPRLQQAIDNPNPDLLTDVDSDDDPALGSEDAVLTIVEFADFGCPYSREASFSIRALATTYGDKIKYVYRDFPIVEIHPEAQMAAEAGGCAEEQNKFWAFHDVLYQNQDDLSRQALRDHARSVGLD
ncbi:MAG: thioredoxin domain-containing protein, partial [bacterium]|nr:thioredoxin domain-containing protein [bacterium]